MATKEHRYMHTILPMLAKVFHSWHSVVRKLRRHVMPRVTYETYRQRHLQLRKLWVESQGVFAAVDPMEQWDLHSYFLCADQPAEVTLRSHYDEIKDSGSSLPQRAGKAYAALIRDMEACVPAGQPIRLATAGRTQKVLAVRSIVKPRVDVDAYVATAMRIVDRLTADGHESTH